MMVSSRLPASDSAAGFRFSCRFEINYIRAFSHGDFSMMVSSRLPASDLVASCRFSCRLLIQLPIRNRQVQRIGNGNLVASCRFRFETDHKSSTNRQPATQLPVADSVSDSKQTI